MFLRSVGTWLWRKCRDGRPLFIWQTFSPRTLGRFVGLKISLIPLSGLSTVPELRDPGAHGPILPELTARAGKQMAPTQTRLEAAGGAVPSGSGSWGPRPGKH